MVKEVHYRFKDKTYFALGLKNSSGGWELRNKYFKNSSSPKDVAHINNGRTKLIITEGMFDLLSIMECNVKLELEYDFLVLNSTAFVQKARGIMKGYSCIDLYLDHDAAGEQATKNFIDHANDSVDRSPLYAGFKDMNEWLMSGAKEANGQGIQDVFLLPQKQSCFAPDGKRNQKMKRTYIRFRCSIYEKKLLKKRAQRAGISLSEYCRSSAFGNTVIERLTPEQLECYRTLVKYKNNFTSIGNMFRKRNPNLAKEVEKLAEEIRQHLYNFKK